MGRNTRRVLIAALVMFGAGVAGAQSRPTMATTSTTTGTTSPSTLAATTTSPVEQIVAIAHTVQPGTPTVTAFTVPAGRQLVVTDVLITNPSTTPVCGAAISPSGAATSAVTGNATTTTDRAFGATTPANAIADTGTITSTAPTTTTTPRGSTVTTPTPTTTTTAATVESGTGTLCIPAQTSLSLALTTGLEFAGGQSVVLANQPLAPTLTTTTGAPAAATATSGPLFYHLRGFLVAPGV